MICVGRRGEVTEIHGGKMKRRRRQFQGRMMHTKPCFRKIQRRYESMKNEAMKVVSKAMREKAGMALTG